MSLKGSQAQNWMMGALLLSPILTAACADMLPDANRIERSRVLAIRTAVTVPLVDEGLETTRAQALPFETVHIEPFVVGAGGPIDPDDVDPLWLACELPPGLGLFACLSEAMPITVAEIPDCPVPTFDALAGDELPPPPPSPCVIGRTGAPDFVVPLSPSLFIGGDVELTMIAGSAPGAEDNVSTDDCAKKLLAGDADLPNDCLFAVQRLRTGPLDYFALTLSELGIEIDGAEAPDPEDVPEPDRNPRITSLRAAVLDDDGEAGEMTELSPGDVVELDVDETLRVEIDQPEDDLQDFLIPINDGESFENETETYEGEWFRTWGRLLSTSSDDPESFNEWLWQEDVQDEAERPPGERAFLYYVVRDGRQGVDWSWLEARSPDAG